VCEIILTIKEEKMDDDIKDTTKVDVTDTKVDDTKASSSIDPGEFEKAKESAAALSSLLEDHGFDSKEDLVEALSTGKDLKDLLGDADAKEVMEKAKTLDSYEQFWATQDEKKKDDDEPLDSDEKVARLEKKITSWEKSKREEELRRSALEESQKALETFNTEVKGVVEKNEAIPKEYRPFVGEFLGVDNPANEIDITKPAEVRKMAKDGIKKIQDFEQAVIKRYREGKLEMTPIEPLDVDQVKEKQPKNLAEARKMATEILQKQFAGR